MARKSRQQRLEQAKSLESLYTEAGLSGVKRHRFITDMINRLEQRDISSGQKKFLDSLIDQGAPEIKNPGRVAEIKAAMEVDGMQHRREPLAGMLRSIAGGWDLSEKQEKFLLSLLAEAKRTKTEGRYRPSGETIPNLRIAVRKVASSGGWYLNHRPGTAKAFQTVRRWLQWADDEKRYKELRELDESRLSASADSLKYDLDVQTRHARTDEPHIDEWNVNKLLGSAKKVLSEMKNPKHLPGELRYYMGCQVALISGEPSFNGREVVYPAIVAGKMIETCDLTKRRTRRN